MEIVNAGIYLHIPFCRSKCRYCSFVSSAGHEEQTERYCRALIRELRALGGKLDGKPAVDTIYFGGGTPSLLAAIQVEHVLAACRDVFEVASDNEISLEANPGTMDRDQLRAWREAGVNRVSLGAQSFSDLELAAIGRIHRAAEIQSAWERLRGSGLKNLNIDLMLGLPGQTSASWRETLEKAAALHPSHVSVYMLEMDPKVPLFQAVAGGLCTLPDDDAVAGWYGETIDFLESRGYRQYEISNFAIPGCECRHNLKYWRCQPVFAFGVAAHSFDGAARYANTAHLVEYLERVEGGGSPIHWHQHADDQRQMEERIFLGLRLRQGLDWAWIRRDFHEEKAASWDARIREFVEEGLLEWHDSKLRLTRRGMLLSNEVFQNFV
jgi:oxygen-independent coproporphyrinogen-3 oxidase